jgi:hypothetical protein
MKAVVAAMLFIVPLPAGGEVIEDRYALHRRRAQEAVTEMASYEACTPDHEKAAAGADRWDTHGLPFEPIV